MRMLLEYVSGPAEIPAVQKIGIIQAAPALAATPPSGNLLAVSDSTAAGVSSRRPGSGPMTRRRGPTARGNGSAALVSPLYALVCCRARLGLVLLKAQFVSSVKVLWRKRAWLGS